MDWITTQRARLPALTLWRDALRMAPPQAIELSLQALRVADGREPGNAIAWGPARHVAAAPRAHVRLAAEAGVFGLAHLVERLAEKDRRFIKGQKYTLLSRTWTSERSGSASRGRVLTA